jgi:signal transduction histidine kinase
MDNNPEGSLFPAQLRMVGRLLASFSHELNNHLAVIKESNGLINDFLEMGGVQNQSMQERLLRITGTVNSRVLRIADMARNLNGFAHRNDTFTASFQLHEVLSEGLAFLARSAELKSLHVSTAFQEPLPAIQSNPSVVQFILASLFFHLLPVLQPDGKILVTAGQQDGAVNFGIRLEGETADSAPGLDVIDHDQALQMALTAVDARLSVQSADGRIGAVLCTLPAAS